MVTPQKTITASEWLNEHGSVIVRHFRKWKLGEIMHDIHDLYHEEDHYQPFVIVRECTWEEYKQQMEAAGFPHLEPDFFWCYYYEVRTD